MATTVPPETAATFETSDTRKDDMTAATEEVIDDLLAEIEAAGKSETFERFLDAQSRFHDYSFRNTLLILLQCSYATRVAGYRTWQDEFDRQVEKGESAIWIWRPITAPKCPECGNAPSYHDSIECEYDETMPEEWSQGIVAFTPCSVFDVSQTEGEPLPTLPFDAKANTGDIDSLLSDMLAAAEKLSASVSVVAANEWGHGEANGVCDTATREIEVRDREAPAVAGTLAHEYAHAVLHSDDDDTEKADREVEAEAVKYVVGRHFDLDMSGSGFYLAAWSDDDAETIRDRLGRINRAARRIIDAVE